MQPLFRTGQFIGIWVWNNGVKVVTFKLDKVTKKYFYEERVFEDYMIGNYSYSIDGGITFVINTITTPINEDPESNPMYNACPEEIPTKIDFSFRDVIIDKGNNFCTATFEFLPNSTTQMKFTIENPKGPRGSLDGQPPFNPNFTLPTSMIVTKQ